MAFCNIKNKLTCAVFALVILIMSATACTSIVYFEKRFKQNIAIDQFALLDAIATQMDEKIFDALVELDSLADSLTPALINRPAEAQRLLDALKKNQTFFDNSIFLFSSSGKLIAASPRGLNLIGTDYSFRTYFKETIGTGKICISPPFDSLQRKTDSIIMFTTPVYDTGGAIIAVVGGALNLKQQHYLRSLAALKLGQNGYLSLYDTERTVLMHQSASRVLQREPPGTNFLVDKALRGYEGTGETVSKSNVPILRSVKTLKSTGWVLAISYPLKDAYAPLFSARKYYLAGGILSAILSALLAYALMKYLTAPLLVFTKHLEQLRSLEDGQRLLHIRSNDEIGILAQRFNEMMAELGRRKDELKEEKEFAESLVLNSSLATFVLDPHHKLLFWNKACEELTGVKAAEILGTDGHGAAFYGYNRSCLADAMIDGSYDALPLQYMKCERSELVPNGWRCEGWMDRKGLRRYLLLDAAPIYGSSGVIVAAIETIQDITELKKTRDEFERSRDFYLTLFENFPALIWRAGTDGKCDYFNRTWLDFTGRSLEEEIGDGWAEGVHPEEFEQCVTGYENAFIARRPFEMEYRLRRHDGEYRWVVDYGRPFNDLNGNFGGYIGSCYDITERKEAATKIAKLSRAIEQSPSAVAIAKLGGIIEYANPRFMATTACSAEELLGRNLQSLKPLAIDAAVERAMQRAINEGEEWQGEIYEWGEGGAVWCEHLSLSPIKDHNGKTTHVLCLKENVTQRKQMEQALLESEKRHRQMFENNPHPMWAYDRETLAFLAVNNAAVRQYGYSREEFGTMTIKDIRPQEDVDALLASVQGITEGIDEAGVWRHVKKDGTVIFVEITSHVMRFGEKDAEIVLACDITDKLQAESEKKALEEQLRQSQKMEAIGTLAGGIAHDFNNILTTIVGYATLLQKKIGEENHCRRYADRILSSADRAANLTQSLLAYSRKQSSNPTAVDLSRIVRGAMHLMRLLIPESIDIKAALAEDALTIMADPGQIEQILMNLVTNARDAIPGTGEVLIKTEAMVLDENYITTHGYGRPGGYALLTVTDTGVGMDEKTRQRIFEPFYTTKEVGKGTGLGLSMVYGIVKQHNGYIDCYSERGEGTTFRIYLPLTGNASPADGMANSNTVVGGDETILLVEDDDAVRELTKYLLEDFGYTVIPAVDGQDAVDKFAEYCDAIELVILDVVMPKKNGQEVFEEINVMRPGIKVLFISGYAAQGVLKADAPFISKPLVTHKLIQKIREVLELE